MIVKFLPFLLLVNFVLSVVFTDTPGQNTSFQPGQVWLDTDGKPIQAHGGGVLYHNGTYYWYGENKDTITTRQHVPVRGVSCYSSKDLYNWKNEGLVLKAVPGDSTHDLHPSKVLERPKVIYNPRTKQFVMWMHVDTRPGYKYARAGVATSPSPTGPFTYQSSVRPNDAMSRDMTIFQDDDGRAYHLHSSEDNRTMYISELSGDYLRHNGNYQRIYVNKLREAPALFKRGGKYYLITSGCTGWSPNPADYAVADSVIGTWTSQGNPCRGPKSEITFNSQSAFVLPVRGKKDAYIFMADRWNPKDLHDSRYIWLPLTFEGDSLRLRWQDDWQLSAFQK